MPHLFLILAASFLMALPGCSKKSEQKVAPLPAPEVKKDILPDLPQNSIYLTNRIDTLQPKDLSFQESSDAPPPKKDSHPRVSYAVGD